jgi:hypothetical protein
VGYKEEVYDSGPFKGTWRWAVVNDPWEGTQQTRLVSNPGHAPGPIVAIHVLGDDARFRRTIGGGIADPQGLTTPDDAEKITDFDKTVRFCHDGKCLDPAKDDTDGDCIKDKDEVRRSVFGRNGWAYHWPERKTSGTARDADGAGNPPELNKEPDKKDSDGGGAPDFVEDLNRDGLRGVRETDPFDREDDGVSVEGVWRHVSDQTSTGFGASVGYESVRVFIQERAEVKLHGNPDGTMTGKAKIEIDKIQQFKYTAAGSPPDCPLTITYTWDHISYDGDATGQWICYPDGANLGVGAGSRKPWRKVITNTCNTNRIEQSDENLGLGFQVLFKTDGRGRDTRTVDRALSKFGGASSVGGSNKEFFDVTLTPAR